MNCRSCGHDSFGDVIDLGLMPLVNNLLDSPTQHCPRWPLKVVFCRKCSLAQLTESPPPQNMFDQYLYFSSQSQTMLAHAANLVRTFVKPGQRVLEIASNDGYLLKQAQDAGASVLGIDPAQNIAAFANERGVPTRCEYFNIKAAGTIARDWGMADVIFANNVLAHVPDPNEVAAGVKASLAADGVAHVETPSLVSMIQSAAFDTIYHEHHSYFSLSALKSLFNRHDLRLIDVTRLNIHGGSLHLQIAHQGDEAKVIQMCETEKRSGVFDDSFYAGFTRRVNDLKVELGQILASFDFVVACGAAAKGVVLLNYFGLDRTRIRWIADVSPHKQGKFFPGTLQEIVPAEKLLFAKPLPDAAVVLAWNIADEIINRNTAFLNHSGRFIVPIPTVRVIDKSTSRKGTHLEHARHTPRPAGSQSLR